MNCVHEACAALVCVHTQKYTYFFILNKRFDKLLVNFSKEKGKSERRLKNTAQHSLISLFASCKCTLLQARDMF